MSNNAQDYWYTRVAILLFATIVLLIQGLGAAIHKQFDTWHLTKAEAEIGLLILKGLSHKEIAQVRQTSERTVREQARALYRKSGLSGRAELSAFFLEDLLLPWNNEPVDPNRI